MEVPLIEFENVTKRFDGKTVLDRVNLTIYEGQVTTLIGKSGSGKSVLLKHIIGLLKPDEGRVLFQGKPLDGMKKGEWDAYRSQLSYMFQNNALFDSMTVFENTALPLRETTTMSKKEIAGRVMARIEQLELSEAAYKYPSELSGGMQKRVALGRALVADPRIVLFDEPTTGQDPIRRNAILSMIAEYQRKFGFTALLISHEIPEVYFISDRILVLYDGGIIFQGTYEELDKFDHPMVDEFVKSLEGFQDELTGLYSRKNFMRMYEKELIDGKPHEGFSVAVFSVSGTEEIGKHLGHAPLQEIIQALGEYINKHFGVVGISTRLGRDQVLTILPYTDVDEAERLIEGFAEDLKEAVLTKVQAEVQSKIGPDICFEYRILAGLTKGKPDEDMETIAQRAIDRQETIARYQCETKGAK